MAQPKPEIGDIWKDPLWSQRQNWLIIDKYIDRQLNTHVVVLRNLQDGRDLLLKAVYIRQAWERVV
jgi:hypothetical protein